MLRRKKVFDFFALYHGKALKAGLRARKKIFSIVMEVSMTLFLVIASCCPKEIIDDLSRRHSANITILQQKHNSSIQILFLAQASHTLFFIFGNG
mmetsp:Transcript_2035/g.2859  ORF Transcript_2035/g.2859 Transcript_2035/m.2859 type:complete len:95 (-) Transcript_2035:102-386(-)